MTKNLQNIIDDLKKQAEIDQRNAEELQYQIAGGDHRASGIISELEILGTQLDETEKSRKRAEKDLNDMVDQHNDLTNSYQCLGIQKRKLEKEVSELRIELDESFIDLKNSDENVKRVIEDAARLADELKSEQVARLSFLFKS